MINRRAASVFGASLLSFMGACSNGEAVPTRGGSPSAGTTVVDRGHFEAVNAESISGWAWDPQKPDVPVDVNIYDGDRLLVTVPANEFRQDLLNAKKGNGKHRFRCTTPVSLSDGQSHTIHARIAPTDTELLNSPKVIQLNPK
jgi:hypothetical protein